MRFDINLASRPYQDARSIFRRWGAILGGVACITAALLLIDYTHWRDNRAINAAIDRVEHEVNQLDEQKNANQVLLNQPANRETRQRSQFLNGIILRKSFSWTRAFSDLEKIMPTRVHLVRIEPELSPPNELKIKMTVEGNSRDKALDLVRKLETSREFKQAHIESETTKSGDTEGAVEFAISAIYVPPPPQAKSSAARDGQEGD